MADITDPRGATPGPSNTRGIRDESGDNAGDRDSDLIGSDARNSDALCPYASQTMKAYEWAAILLYRIWHYGQTNKTSDPGATDPVTQLASQLHAADIGKASGIISTLNRSRYQEIHATTNIGDTESSRFKRIVEELPAIIAKFRRGPSCRVLNECDISEVYETNEMNTRERERERQRVRRRQAEEQNAEIARLRQQVLDLNRTLEQSDRNYTAHQEQMQNRERILQEQLDQERATRQQPGASQLAQDFEHGGPYHGR